MAVVLSTATAGSPGRLGLSTAVPWGLAQMAGYAEGARVNVQPGRTRGTVDPDDGSPS